MTNEELVNKYLANGGTVTKIPAVDLKYEPHEGRLQRTGPRPIYDMYDNRIYQNLDKTLSILPIDETMLDYGIQ